MTTDAGIRVVVVAARFLARASVLVGLAVAAPPACPSRTVAP